MTENKFTIRKYKAEDKENVLKVLYETSSMPTETEEQREFLRLMFNDYYTEEEPDNCFVVDCGGEAVGYIICAENYKRYERVFKDKYIPLIKRLGMTYLITAVGELFIHRLISKRFPAHLHIDILPVCQGVGAGSELVRALCEHLASKGVKGLMLSCGMGNKGAIRFYKKNNFRMLINFFGNCLMAKEII